MDRNGAMDGYEINQLINKLYGRIAELEKMVTAEQEASQAITDLLAKANKRIEELEAEALNNRLACESMQARLDAAKNCPTHEATGCDSRGETFTVVYLLKDDVLKALGGDDVN